MRFSDLAGSHGFGRDEDGDARRREEQGVADLGDGTTVAGIPAHLVPGLTADQRAALSAAIGDDLLRRACAIQEEARRMQPKRPPRGPSADWTVQDDPEPVPGHQLTLERHGEATVARCECGRWDGGWLGPRSRRRVLDGHAAHVAAELSATGPLIVPSERADRPKELE